MELWFSEPHTPNVKLSIKVESPSAFASRNNSTTKSLCIEHSPPETVSPRMNGRSFLISSMISPSV